MPALTPGTYRAKAINHKLGETAKGGEQILVTFEILTGEHKGQSLYWYGFFTEKTLERTLESLEACGWDGESIAKAVGLGSKEVELVVEYETSQSDGKQYLRVRWVNAPRGAALKKELDRGGVAALEERLKGAMLARKAKREEAGDDSFDYGANGYRDGGDGPPV